MLDRWLRKPDPVSSQSAPRGAEAPRRRGARVPESGVNTCPSCGYEVPAANLCLWCGAWIGPPLPTG